MTANQIKQMGDEDIILFHHNLPPFLAQRMSWLRRPILRQRHTMRPPELSELPPLTPLELRSPLTPGNEDDELLNPDDLG
jgi:type IV secretory pathway TraG/TraD family ATPase VirD4